MTSATHSEALGAGSAAGSYGAARTRDFVTLMKPRVMSLVVFTALVGLALAPGVPHPVLAAIALVAIAIGAGASGALNMAFDADIDARMGRTAQRPIPSGHVSREVALAFGTILAGGSVITLGMATNPLAAALLALTIGFYVVVYTLVLKRRTPQNIVIGGAAGALPPVVGWASATGTVTLEPVLLFTIIFLWTPPHFWALAILKRDEYRAAGVPMLPVVAGRRAVSRNIFAYAVLTAVAGLLPTAFGFASSAYAVVAFVLGVWFVHRSAALLHLSPSHERQLAGRLFGVSILYLFALFGALLADRLAGGLL